MALQAWRSAWLGLLRMPVAFLITLVASTLLEAALSAFRIEAAPAAAGAARPALAMLAISFAVSTARYLVAAPLAIAMHRFVLLGETVALLPLRPVARVMRFAAWLAAVGVVSDVGLFLLAKLPGQVVLLPVLQILGVVLAIRLILVFPQVALGARGHVVRRSLAATRWQFWRIVAISFVTGLPVLVAVIATVVLARLLGPSLAWLRMLKPATAILIGTLTPLCCALAAASASWLLLVYDETDINRGYGQLPAEVGTRIGHGHDRLLTAPPIPPPASTGKRT